MLYLFIGCIVFGLIIAGFIAYGMIFKDLAKKSKVTKIICPNCGQKAVSMAGAPNLKCHKCKTPLKQNGVILTQ